MAGNSTSIGDALGLALKNLREEKEKNNKSYHFAHGRRK